MEKLQVKFRDKIYIVNYEMEPINWINVYIIFVQDPHLINLIGRNFFQILQVTTELQNTYWYSSKKEHDKEANDFKRIVANTIRNQVSIWYRSILVYSLSAYNIQNASIDNLVEILRSNQVYLSTLKNPWAWWPVHTHGSVQVTSSINLGLVLSILILGMVLQIIILFEKSWSYFCLLLTDTILVWVCVLDNFNWFNI